MKKGRQTHHVIDCKHSCQRLPTEITNPAFEHAEKSMIKKHDENKTKCDNESRFNRRYRLSVSEHDIHVINTSQ